MKSLYSRDFYAERHERTRYSAQRILGLLLPALPTRDSAIDFGCGVGTWLSTLALNGFTELRGLDGDWVEMDLLEITAEQFRQVNFEEAIASERRFDLAISVEVAEHVSATNARQFTQSICAASDFVLFSAAIPRQGGSGHINERWPSYWVELFAENGYRAFDPVRAHIWGDAGIPVWYRQNLLFFVHEEAITPEILADLASLSSGADKFSLVHPQLYQRKLQRLSSVSGSWGLFRRAVKLSIKRRLRKIRQ